MRRRVSLPSLLVVAALTLGACGSSETEGESSAAGPPLAERSPQEILQATRGALAKVRSYRVEVTGRDADGPLRFEGEIAQDGRARLVAQQAGLGFEVRVIGRESFLKGDRDFWLDAEVGGDPATARLLADRWVKSPDNPALLEAVDELRPTTLAYCLGRDLGKVTKVGEGEFAGQPSVILDDDGRAPGGSPSRVDIATSGAPLPLRVIQTGPERPGGQSDPRCGNDEDDEPDTTIRAEQIFSDFDEPIEITEPTDVLDLDALEGQAPPGQVS